MYHLKHKIVHCVCLIILSLISFLTLQSSAIRLNDVLTPIPQDHNSTKRSWYQIQRLRFFNSALSIKAEQYIRSQEYQKAIPLLKEALQNHPNHTPLQATLLDCYYHNKEWEKGIALCEKLLLKHPGFEGVRIYMSLMSFQLQQYETAIENGEIVLQTYTNQLPQIQKLCANLVEACWETGQLSRAKEFATQCLQNPNDPRARLLIIETAVKNEDWQEAYQHIEKAIEHATHPEIRGILYLKKGEVLHAMQEFASAKNVLVKAKELLAERSYRLQIESLLGKNAAIQGLYTQSAKHFKSYLLEDFNEQIAKDYLTTLMDSLEWEVAKIEAKSFLRDTNAHSPFYEVIQRVLMICYKNLNENKAYYQQALALFQESEQTVYLLEIGLAAERIGKTSEAIEQIGKYLENNTDDQIVFNYYINLLKYKKIKNDFQPLLRALPNG